MTAPVDPSTGAVAGDAASLAGQLCFVEGQWLQRFCDDGKDPGPLNNATAACPHGLVGPGQAPAFKLVSQEGWAALTELYPTSGPVLRFPEACCPQCIRKQLEAVEGDVELDQRRQRIAADVDTVAQIVALSRGDSEGGRSQDMLTSASAGSTWRGFSSFLQVSHRGTRYFRRARGTLYQGTGCSGGRSATAGA